MSQVNVTMTLNQFIDTNDLEYELKLIKNPSDEHLWLEYAHRVPEFKRKMFIMERATRFCSSHELWLAYIELVLDQIRHLSYADHANSYKTVNGVFQRSLEVFPQDLGLWKLYFTHLNKQPHIPFIINQYITALRAIDVNQHMQIWGPFLDFIELIARVCQPLAGMLMRRFLSYGQYETRHLYKYIQWTGDLDYFYLQERAFDDWDTVLDLGNQLFCTNYIQKFPDQFSKGYLALATKTNPEQRIHLLHKALTECPTIYDFTKIYEELLEVMEPNETSTDTELDQFEQLVNDRGLFVNDIHLKQDQDNLDTWFQRFDLFKNDLQQLITTHVEALSSINPLKCHSDSYKLSDIWIDYADIYGNSNDFDTVDLIYSKAKESKFKGNELVDIYKAWTKVYLDTDINKAIKILQDILFTGFPNIQLWDYYFEILEIHIDDIQTIIQSYYKMMDLQCATPLLIIQFTNFLENENLAEMFKVFETALHQFKDPQMKLQIYNTYLVKLIKHGNDTETIRDVFDKCLELPVGAELEPVIILYSEFEYGNSLVVKSFNLVNDFLKKYPKLNLIKILLQRFEFDKRNLRLQFPQWLELKWTNQELASLCIELVQFEVAAKQYQRARAIFKFLHQSIAYDFKHWQDFELNYGDEAGFKEMLRIKRNASHIPHGFVKAVETQNPTKNPEEIELDM